MCNENGRSVLALALTLTLLPGLGCNRGKPSDAGKDGKTAGATTIVVYTDRGKKFLDPIAAAFKEKTGISVTLHTAGSMEILTRLKTEDKATTCDVFLSKDSATLEQARNEGLFRKLDKPLLTQIPAKFRAKNGEWVGVSARMRVIVYNKTKISPGRIASVFSLARPEFAGKVGTVKSDNGSFISGVTSLLADHGKTRVQRFLKGLKHNSKGHVFPKHTPTVKAVASGEVVLGYVNHYYYYRHLAKDPKAPIGIVFPDQDGKGASWNVAGVALTQHAKQRDAATRFIQFLLSDEGQQLFAEKNFEYPVSPQVPTHPAVKPRKEIRLTDKGVEVMGTLRPEAISLIQEMGLD